MLLYIVAALSSAADAGDPAVGSWSDIIITHNKGTSGTTASTITFTSGAPREILVTHDVVIGTLQYKLGSGSYIFIDSGDTFEVTTGTTVTFKYTCFWDDESATVTVTDNTLSATIATFDCDFTFTG